MTTPRRHSWVGLALLATSLCVIASFVVRIQPVKAAAGAVSITTLGVPVSESFDTLITTGTATWVNDATILGWYHARTGTGTTIVANNGGSNAGNLYSYGTGTSSDRALGSIGSGNAAAGNFHWGVRLANETGSTITSLTISYTGEQWRNGGAGVAQSAAFSYRVGTGLGGALTDFTTGGVNVPELDFTSPVAVGTTGAALDGNVNSVPIVHTIRGLSLAHGQEILLRWADPDHAGADHGLAIDDLVITAQGGGAPTVSINEVSVMEGNSDTRTATFTVSVSSSAHDGVTFDIATADGTGPSAATVADGDYVARSETAQSIPAGETTYSFAVTVNGDTVIEPDEAFIVMLGNVAGATLADDQGTGTIVNDDSPPPVNSPVVISQVYGGGGNAGATLTHDFVELFNRGTQAVPLAGWSVQYISAAGTGTWAAQALTGSIAPGGYYLVQLAMGTGGTTALPTPNASGTIAMSATAGKVALRSSTTEFVGGCPVGAIDFVGYGNAGCFEGAGAAGATTNVTAALRKRGGCFDSDNNNIDFAIGTPTPRNSASPTIGCTPTPHEIHDIQGNGLTTPFAGQFVSTSGIVTGVKTNGFFLQAPAAAWDANAATSEALFVFTQAAPAVTVGHSVVVQGTATEFFDLTQIESTLPGDIVTIAQGQTVPAPIPLTPAILDPTGTPRQLEPLEAMRVSVVSLTSVAPTNDFGETFTVLTGVPRPMREPGISVLEPVPPDPVTGVLDCCIPRFDENPERIAIDSDGLAGAPVFSVTSNVVIGNVTGPLDFTFGAYKVLPEVPPAASPNMSGVPVPSPAADEFTVGGFNIENFASDATRRVKAALAIRQLMRSPDVIGHIEILDLATLQTLADEVNAQTVAAGQPNPGYEAVLIPAPQGGTQNVGFLVKTTRVRIDAVSQERASDVFTNPNTGMAETLHDRPPLVLRATVDVDANGTNPRPVIVVVNHLRSFIDIELVSGEGPRVRAKRTAQAESVAGLLQELQTGNPGTAVISIGDYNAFQFNDGYTDPIAVLLGTPTPDDQVVVEASPDLVDPNFVNLTNLLPGDQQYSFIFEGTPQALDHVLVNTVANAYVQRYAIARGNADFPELPQALFSGDATRPERSSDHDMPVAYFRFPPPSADLSLLATAAPATVSAGEAVTFTYTVTNAGSSPAQNVVLTAPVSNAAVTSCTSTGGGACGGSATTPTVSFATLAAEATATITIVATAPCTVANGASIATLASVAASTSDPDSANNSAVASATASNAGPSISEVSATPNSLGPPLYKMAPVTVDYAVSDSCGAVTTQLSVTSNEPVTAPVNLQGQAALTSPDWQVIDAHHVLLRSERSVRGNGRIYTITITATDAAGSVTTRQVTVTVPRHLP